MLSNADVLIALYEFSPEERNLAYRLRKEGYGTRIIAKTLRRNYNKVVALVRTIDYSIAEEQNYSCYQGQNYYQNQPDQETETPEIRQIRETREYLEDLNDIAKNLILIRLNSYLIGSLLQQLGYSS